MVFTSRLKKCVNPHSRAYVFHRSRAHCVLLSAKSVDALSRRHQWVLGYHYNINVIIARLKLATNKNIGQNTFSRELIQHHFYSYTIVSLTIDI